MGEADILSKIRLRYNQLTKSQKRVADFILNDATQVLNFSISELAETCDVSDATVFRFCCDIGLQGYQDFKRILAQFMTYYQGTLPIPEPVITPEAGTLENIMQKNLDAIYETKKLVNMSQIEIATDWMTSAERILFLGVGASLSTAFECYNHFARVTPKVVVSMDTHMQIVSASTLTPRDMAIIISYSGSSRESVEMAKCAKARGAKIACITHFLKSPLTIYADLVLLCGTNERVIESHSITSEIAQLFVVDILYQEFYRKNKASCKELQSVTAEALLPHVY